MTDFITGALPPIIQFILMANWCLNTVTFEADETVREQIRLLFIEMAAREILTNKGQLPSFYSAESGYLFEIDWQESGLTYLTKWSPNILVMVAVASQYGAEFLYKYDEISMGIYGVAIYRKSVLIDVYLEPEDFGLYEYDKQSESYVFEGENYREDWVILEILLQRKLTRLYKPNS